jgi:hypothetical protein
LLGWLFVSGLLSDGWKDVPSMTHASTSGSGMERAFETSEYEICFDVLLAHRVVRAINRNFRRMNSGVRWGMARRQHIILSHINICSQKPER